MEPNWNVEDSMTAAEMITIVTIVGILLLSVVFLAQFWIVSSENRKMEENAKKGWRKTGSKNMVSNCFDEKRRVSLQKAEMLRRRVMLRNVDREIDKISAYSFTESSSGSVQEFDTINATQYTLQQIKHLDEKAADCTNELVVLARSADIHHKKELVQALQILLDAITFYLAPEHRDMNKVTIFCNSLVKYDGLTRLQHLQKEADKEIRLLATAIIEKAVPAIWH
uniref:Uncharacterized protein AlNc14C102G6067 n=1 Tax=Albugo laibachii Nc14 TaxID=890382 RepID=F0WHN0_9STRA|nr:conserved hypothetical protein [Albugo laibachii Nc14]|eukprot:CCA20723.1 conserved hypothetical protein [Albugo laibachii Nc14]